MIWTLEPVVDYKVKALGAFVFSCVCRDMGFLEALWSASSFWERIETEKTEGR